MQVSVEKTNSYTITLTLKENAVEMNKFYKKTLENISKNSNFDGFRKGSTVPEDVIVNKFGKETLESYTIEEALKELYPKALRKEKIIPVDQGRITKVESNIPLHVVMEIETYPEIKLDEKKMKKISISLPETKIGAKEVNARLTELEMDHKNYEQKDDKNIEKNDKVLISCQGYDKKGGTAIEQTKVEKYPLVIGSNSFIPGFEEALIGKKKDEEIGFPITFPKDYHNEEFKGKKVYFTVEIFEIHAPKKIEWTDEFIEKITGKKINITEFKKEIKADLLAANTEKNRRESEEKLLDELVKISTFEIGPKLLEREIQRIFDSEKSHIEHQWMDMKHYLEHLKMSEEEFKEKQIKPVAKRRLEGELILHHIREIQQPEVTDSEVQKEVDVLTKKYTDPKILEQLQKAYTPGSQHWEEIKYKISYKKIIDNFLVVSDKE